MGQINEVSGIIEFYSHAIPYLASTRERNITAVKGETVIMEFPGLNIDNGPVERTVLLKEILRIPRGPDS